MNHQARTIIFTEKSSISFSASCSFPQTLWRQRLSSSSRLNEKRVSLYSSIRVLIEKDLFNLSAALPRDPFHSLANNRHQCCKWICASTFTQHSDSLLSNSIFLFHNSSRCSAVITMTLLFLLLLVSWGHRGIDGSWDGFSETQVGRTQGPFELVFMPVSARGFALFRQQDTAQLRKRLDF